MTKTEFLRRVRDRLGLADMDEADAASRSVLSALADRITDEEARDLASQLPKEFDEFVRGRVGPVQKVDIDTFIGRIQSDLDIDTWDHAAEVGRGVFSVLKDAVSEGEWRAVADHLPRELQEMFVTA